MNETDFLRLTAQTLSRIEQAIEKAGLDFEQPADGILEIEFDDASKIVINRHGAAQEIWVAARTGGFHFSHDGLVWRDTRDKSELSARLADLIEIQGGGTVDFGGPL
jgi:CyaY protein